MADFNPNEHLSKLRGKDYLEVKWRLVWFQQATGARAGYVTFELEHDRQNGYARYACIAWDGSDETWRDCILAHGKGVTVEVCGRVATGMKSETRADFPDFAEKAETGAIGRALAGLGFGTQFAPDVEEGARIVDTPVQRQQQPAPPKPAQPTPAEECAALGHELKLDEKEYRVLVRSYTHDGKVNWQSVKSALETKRSEASLHDGHMEQLHSALAAHPAD